MSDTTMLLKAMFWLGKKSKAFLPKKEVLISTLFQKRTNSNIEAETRSNISLLISSLQSCAFPSPLRGEDR